MDGESMGSLGREWVGQVARNQRVVFSICPASHHIVNPQNPLDLNLVLDYFEHCHFETAPVE
jgi:hypothetical protein